jgi:hypothetical protein
MPWAAPSPLPALRPPPQQQLPQLLPLPARPGAQLPPAPLAARMSCTAARAAQLRGAPRHDLASAQARLLSLAFGTHAGRARVLTWRRCPRAELLGSMFAQSAAAPAS